MLGGDVVLRCMGDTVMMHVGLHEQVRQENIRVLITDRSDISQVLLNLFLDDFDRLDLVGTTDANDKSMGGSCQVTSCMLVTDLNKPLMSGANATRLIHQQYPQLEALILCTFKHDRLSEAALKVIGPGSTISLQ